MDYRARLQALAERALAVYAELLESDDPRIARDVAKDVLERAGVRLGDASEQIEVIRVLLDSLVESDDNDMPEPSGTLS